MHQRLPGFLTTDEQGQLLALADSPGWQDGRQHTGYQKLPLDALSPAALLAKAMTVLAPYAPLAYDCFLLRYPLHSEIPEHVDPPLAEGWRHLRLNAVLRQSIVGGVLFLEGEAVPLEVGDAILFWPDQCRHRVSRVEVGARLLWSVGCNYLG